MDNNWSIETIQETAANSWSLEGDNQLLNLMKSISKNLEQRCMTSNNNLNRLMLDVDKTKIKLGNATTKLLDLNNGKFVEHTVMDMDSSVSNTEKCTPAENDKAFVPIPKAVEEAVTNGLNMMDRCYEKVLLNLEDSEDEDENDNGQKHVVCRPKNPYLNRPLPHLIGSKQWNDKWHVGLIESDEEVLSDEEPEEPEFSQSSSDEGDSLSNSPQTSNPPTTSESDFAVSVPAVIHPEDLFHRLADDDDAETKSPLFPPEDNKHREKIKVLPTVKPSIQGDAKIEPVNKTKQLTEPPVPALEQPKQSIFVQQKPEPKFLNLFDDEPPSLEEPIRRERKPVNLFLDSDDENDEPTTDTRKPSSIFNNNVATSQPTLPFSIPQSPKVDKKKIEFNRDVDNNNVAAVAKSEIKPTLKSNDFGGLFDDEPPDDFFDIIVREQGKNVDIRNPEKPKLQSKTVNLFDSDDDDDDFSKIIGTTTKKDSTVPPVSTKESAPVVKQSDISYSPFNSPFRSLKNNDPPKSYVSFLDDESPSIDDDKNDTAPSHQPSSRTSLFDDTPPDDISVPVVPSHQPSSRASLFDDTPPDDIFVPVVPSKQKSPTKIIYDDIASTLRETSSAKANISNDSLKSHTPDDASVKAPPVVLPRKPELKTIPSKVVDKSKSTVTDKIPVLSPEPKSDVGTRDETDQSLSFRKNLSMFANPVATTLLNVDKESKPKPNKLKTNFNINVAALLPGAKLPSQKQSTTEKSDRTVEPDPEPEKTEDVVNRDKLSSVSNVKQSSSTEDTSGRLTCLSKDRAKIQVQRKPSTRMGRQKLYNKTLTSENDSVVPSVETTDSVRPEVETVERDIEAFRPEVKTVEQDIEAFRPEVKTVEQDIDVIRPEMKTEQDIDAAKSEIKPIEAATSENVLESAVQDTDSLSEVLKYDQPPSLQSNDFNSNIVADDDEEDWLKNIDEKPPSPSKTNFYDDDWLSTKPVNEERKPSTQNISHVMNYDWLTASSLPPEDIDPPSNYSVDDDHEQDDWLSSYMTKERCSVVADLPNDDDDWLIAAERQDTSRGTVSTVTGAKRKDEEEVEKDWLVQATLEQEKKVTETADDADDDWLTKSLVPPKESTIVTDKVPVSDTMNKLSDARSETFESNVGTSQTLKSGLFDSDDELTRSKSDVGKTGSNIFESKIETKNFLSSTIFDDDDEDVTAVPSYLEPKPDVSKPNQPKVDFASESSDAFKSKTDAKKSLNSTLFDDDDDDDDLFASIKQKKSSAKQPTTEAVKTTKNASIKTTAKSLFSDDDNSDPDDLFGPTTKKQKGKIEAGHKAKMDKPKQASLFDDEDDDDEDIFAPKSQKQQRVAPTDTKKKPSITKSVTTIPASSDPLADLLK
ncbi:WASH complex subunit 2 isoform X2 [Bradysia coprophila]|uniref:WASH complex subunit 2 isoform X2 n=1 Tax=Bradysia coprophila TaxID=38358 RepID=UPI00187DCC9E|nr:WASH complex subunit 2 isoform X2 [Bradysia coprophila]